MEQQEISMKNTKNEILKAYEALLKQVQEKKQDDPKKEQEQRKQEKFVKQAGSLSYDKIVSNIAGIKTELTSELDKLSERFIDEFKRFEELQLAIQVEKKNLEELYGLSVNTDSLAAMILAQKAEREKFEEEMAEKKEAFDTRIKEEKEQFESSIAEKRLQWKKEQEAHAEKQKEEADESKKKKAREEEEYQYNLKLTRKKETDAYEERKQKLEKDLIDKKKAFEQEVVEREAGLKAAEKELEDLRVRNHAFPGELDKAVAAAVKETTDKLQSEFKYVQQLKAKENEGELRLKDQWIETLRGKIKDLETQIKEMAQKTTTAESSVKDIALRAIESSGKVYYAEKPKETSTKE